MEFSVGLLYSSQELLKYIITNSLKVNEFIDKFPNYSLFGESSSEKVLEICQEANWININSQGQILLSESARIIIDSKDYKEMLRNQIKSIILISHPTWSKLIPFGRKHTLDYLPDEIYECFDHADLTKGYDEEIIKWWDILSIAVRGLQNDLNLTTGRLGEELSIRYELERTKCIP